MLPGCLIDAHQQNLSEYERVWNLLPNWLTYLQYRKIR
jgi:hypothetical protein